MKFILILCLSIYSLALEDLKTNESYFEAAGDYYDINPLILYAIAKTESNFNPKAINCGNNNGSCDYGLMQINSVHLPLVKRAGLTKEDLFDPKISVFFGARVLKNCLNRHGFNHRALNCYNGRITNNTYYQKVLRNYYSLNDMLDELR